MRVVVNVKAHNKSRQSDAQNTRAVAIGVIRIEACMRKIAFFLRIFENVRYLEDFLDGKIYINRLSYFRQLEESQEGNRADPKEGLAALWQPNDVIFEVNGHRLTDFAAPIESRTVGSDNLHVFCLFAGATNESNLTDPSKIDVIKQDLKVPEDLANLGTHTVLIYNSQAFIDRMVSAVKHNGYRGQAGMVEYYDPESFTGEFGDRAAFYKQHRYSHQKEYRFAINTGTEGTDALVIDIGSIRDIATISDSWDIQIDIKLRAESEKIV